MKMKIYLNWVLLEDLQRFSAKMILSHFHSKQCDVCKGFYRVPKYTKRLYRCRECADLSYRLCRKAGHIPDSVGHFTETSFP